MLLDNEDVALTKRAIENGAFLCVKKPIPVGTSMYLWQHVLSEKMRRLKRNGQFEELTALKRYGLDRKDVMTGYMIDGTMLDINYQSKKKVTCLKIEDRDQQRSLQQVDDYSVKFGKQVWTEWTQELHERFMYAVRQLGEGRTFFLHISFNIVDYFYIID